MKQVCLRGWNSIFTQCELHHLQPESKEMASHGQKASRKSHAERFSIAT